MMSTASDAAHAIPESTTQFIHDVRERVGTVVVGQDVVVERLLIALFTSGHLLLQGVPGLAKTLLVSALSKSIDLEFSRIQFTVDLLPSDIVGSEILDQQTHEFRTHKGLVLANIRAQSSLRWTWHRRSRLTGQSNGLVATGRRRVSTDVDGSPD